jgi:hypothetical protein
MDVGQALGLQVRGFALGVVVCSSLFIGLASAQAASPDTFQVSYFSELNQIKKAALDESIRITNPGTSVENGGNFPIALCAMIYVFGNSHSLRECCGCSVSPDEVLTLSLQKDLTSNPFTTTNLSRGNIEIISALSNGSPCDATGGGKLQNGTFAFNIFPAPALRAWATHVNFQPILGGGWARSITEEELEDSTLILWELDNVQTLCTLIAGAGGGTGVCTCGTVGG